LGAAVNSDMVPITIGVPVFNGADLLDECLSCLARQTFRDFKVLIFDNASTDATPEIARAWAERDSRFHHVRQPSNVNVLANFRDALRAAESPWFMWRADDDLSADDYLETLYRLATQSPGCKLAVSSLLTRDLDDGRRRLTEAPKISNPERVGGRVRTLIGFSRAWFYGLWDRETLLDAFVPVSESFPFAYAVDTLTLYGPSIDGGVRTTRQTTFIKRARRTAATPRQSRMPFDLMVSTRRLFCAELQRMRGERQISAPLRVGLAVSEPIYLNRALPSLLKMARTKAREMLGIAGHRSPGRHFGPNR
jgi:glycosyltransferase involved in cell wall biosynthesis